MEAGDKEKGCMQQGLEGGFESLPGLEGRKW